MPGLLDAFVAGHDVNLIAYGQTGSGKTHTLFGPPGLLGRAATGEFGAGEHESYGMFPRAAVRLVEKLRSEGEGGAPWALTGSVVELYMGENLDLLDGRSNVYVDIRNSVCKLYGATEHRIRTAEDLWPVFGAANSRTTAATGAHDASSRSHCFVVLSLWRRVGEGTVRLSRFQFADLAGSERLSDTADGAAAGMAMWEGMATNFTLLMLTQVVEVATSNQRGGGKKSHVPVRRCDLTKLLSGSVYGRALLACVVTMSQAPRNGTKSWLSLQWGSKLAPLRLRSRLQPARPLAAVAAEAERGAAECEAVLARTARGRFSRIREALLRRHRHELELVAEFEA